MEEKINELLREYDYSEDEAKNAILFVHEFLITQVDHIKENEPYATTTIKEKEEAAYMVYNLLDLIDE